MKKILQWIFKDQWEKLKEDNWWEMTIYQMRMDRNMQRGVVAEKALKQLGYELEFEDNVRVQPSETTHEKDMGWKLVKIK